MIFFEVDIFPKNCVQSILECKIPHKNFTYFFVVWSVIVLESIGYAWSVCASYDPRNVMRLKWFQIFSWIFLKSKFQKKFRKSTRPLQITYLSISVLKFSKIFVLSFFQWHGNFFKKNFFQIFLKIFFFSSCKRVRVMK